MTDIENLLTKNTPRPKHRLYLVNAPEINPTILSLIVAINLIKKSGSSGEKILLKNTVGTFGKNNKRISFLKNDIATFKSQFLTLDKYSFSDILFDKDYWLKIEKDYPDINTIIISDITTFALDANIKYTETEKTNKYQLCLREMRLFAENKNKYIVIIETKMKNEEYINPFIFKQNVYNFIIENNKMSLLDYTDNSFQLTISEEKNSSDDEAIDIRKLISNIKRINFDNVAKSSLRTLPLCKTGFSALDIKLGGGFELGQVVSIVSSDNDILTQFSLQMATQLPDYYNPLYICLTMNLRRLKNMLSHKNKIQEDNQYYNSNQENIHLLTNDKLENDGDVLEIIEAIEYYYENEDSRIIFIDSDDMLQIINSTFNDSRREVDEIYKRLQVLANKLDILIIIHSESTQEILDKVRDKEVQNIIPIDNSIKAIKYAKTQVHIEDNGITIMKSLKRVIDSINTNNQIQNKGNSSTTKQLGNFIDVDVE